jgi:hypothetical protein
MLASPNPLTRRERRVYKAIYYLTASVWLCFLCAFLFFPRWMWDVNLLDACLMGVNTVAAFCFNCALRMDLRIIRGVPWLLEGPIDPLPQRHPWDFFGP